ncbi:hypothetical protein NDU88_012071 [Pleurodeles waltl]|uniref:Uncharacterized protein n=1 Tax=Pleurodeles waltl TaxID=8319 RepID=A0AAV7R288_PLEWA|nr:hypothetical protein NDU88_012071 [Pleurodeles waltl]
MKQGENNEVKTPPEGGSQEKDLPLDWEQTSMSLKAIDCAALKGGEVAVMPKDAETYMAQEGSFQLGPREQGNRVLPQVTQEGICTTKEVVKVPAVSKDGGDKFYSLTEDSNSSNSNLGTSESRDSISSESASFLSLAESTVRQRRRRTKGLVPSSKDNAESSAQTQIALEWDCSGTDLMSTVETHSSQNTTKMIDESACGPIHVMDNRHTDSDMLQSIYNSIKELQTETRAESRRARLATKQLQGTVRKVVKSCTEIEGKLSSIEERTSVVEGEIETLRVQTTMHDGQLTDIMWKLEDQENRQRRNNLHFLGIKEDAEGSNIRAYMIKVLQEAFPELSKWDWEAEVQRVHRSRRQARFHLPFRHVELAVLPFRRGGV